MALYQWKPDTHILVDPQVAGERLESLRLKAEGGVVTPRDIVEDARPTTSPLHPAFEWDDKIAAEKYREDRARYLMRHIVVSITRDVHEEPVVTRAFVSVVQGDRPAYTSIQVAMSDADLRAQVLKRAEREIKEWKQKYKDLKELEGIFSAIDALVLI